MRKLFYFVLIMVLGASAPLAAQKNTQPTNIILGTKAFQGVIFAPDPAWNTGADGIQDQRCQVDSGVLTGNWAGSQNVIALSCFGVAHPQTGAWDGGFTMRGYTGHTSNQYLGGYRVAAEGQRVNGVETVDRWYVYRFRDGQTIMHIGFPYADTLVIGENTKPIHLYSTGRVFAGGGFQAPSGTMGVTVQTCTRFEAGLCVEGN